MLVLVTEGHSHNENHGKQHKCLTADPSPNNSKRDWERTRRKLAAISSPCEELCKQCIEIASPTGYVIPHPYQPMIRLLEQGSESVTLNDFSQIQHINRLIDLQVKVINARFKLTPFRFKHMNPHGPTLLPNNDYTLYALSHIEHYSQRLKLGSKKVLNVFLSFAICDVNNPDGPYCATLGLAFLPSYDMGRFGDGVHMRIDTLTGGGYPDNDNGLTLVHEIGHWLGLYHTFSNSLRSVNGDPCDPRNANDFVDDTPLHAAPSQNLYNCSKRLYEDIPIPDSCPNAQGNDPVFNFMNYVTSEECQPEGVGEFTCGQIERMYAQWFLYRVRDEPCEDSEIRVEFYMRFENHNRFNKFKKYNEFSIRNEKTGGTIFNSTEDYDDVFAGNIQLGLFVDICLPNNQPYQLVFLDREGDGFEGTDASFQIDVDGRPVAKLQGIAFSQRVVGFNGGSNNTVGTTSSATTAITTTTTTTRSMVMTACLALAVSTSYLIIGV